MIGQTAIGYTIPLLHSQKSHHHPWMATFLTSFALLISLIFSAQPAEARTPRCPLGTHSSSNHCCPHGTDWVRFEGCVEHEPGYEREQRSQRARWERESRQQVSQQEPEQENEPTSCPAGQELVGSMCQPISCPIGQELVGFSCQPINCPMGQELVGSMCQPINCPPGEELEGFTCVPSSSCPMGTSGNPPFCH
jgi:hypothetical protein